VTARTVQFYVAEGLIPSPARQGNRLDFDDTHIEALLEVKRQQAAGKSLEEITATTTRLTRELFSGLPGRRNVPLIESYTTLKMNTLTDHAEFRAAPGLVDFMELGNTPTDHETTVRFRWHIDLGRDRELSGAGRPPQQRTIDAIRALFEHEAKDIDQEDE
jgi:DNA-binding transcriptional MerR regulator